MSAVCGIVARGAKPEGLPAALAAMAHWGSRTCTWQENGAALGVRQPSEPARRNSLYQGDGVVVVADVRFDDRQALCDALGIDRGRRAAVTDAELVACAWRKWGEDCASALYGDFAFAIYEPRLRRLFCARDHVGVRPFYFAALPSRFVFASNMPAVLDVPGVPLDLDQNMMLAAVACLPFIDLRRTVYPAVRILPAGHVLTVDFDRGGAMRERRYWRPACLPRAAPATDADYAEELLDHCRRAVAVRLPAAAGCPGTDVAVHLTGGIDSSAITVLANRELRHQGRMPPVAFCWQPPPSDSDRQTLEHIRIEAVRAQEDVRLRYNSTSVEDVVAAIRSDCTISGGADPNVAAAAQAGARVLLSGLGGDDCVSSPGYGLVPHLLLRGRWATLAAELRARQRKLFAAVVLDVAALLIPRFGAKYGKARRTQPPWRALLTALTRPLPNRRFFHARKPAGVPTSSMPRFLGVRSTHLKFLADGHLALRMSHETESGMQQGGVEYRYPLLDRRLLEFGISLPDACYYRYPGRLVMRQAFDGLLPAVVCWNTDKHESIRFTHACNQVADAFPFLLAALEERQAAPVGADYVDLPAVLASLREPAAFRARPRPEPILAACGVLGF